MAKRISGGMLYSAVQCPHRVFLDATQADSLRDEPNAFVEMLWEHGLAHEAAMVEEMAASLEDLSQLAGDDKTAATLQAMDAGAELIYSGRIEADDMVGEPDLLRKTPQGYVAGDIKSGRGLEGGDDDDEGKPKLHYAMQLAHYAHILERIGRGTGKREGFIIDRNGDDIAYDLDLPIWGREKRTSWDRYTELLAEIRGMLSGAHVTRGALASVCGLCHWHTYCSDELGRLDDLTLIPELGRAKRDVMAATIGSVNELAKIDIATFVKGTKTDFKGIGPDSLAKFQERAKLLSSSGAPYLKQAHGLPDTPIEVFFDVETDPMRNLCYLHGYYIVDLETGKTEYKSFFMRANTPEDEAATFAESWALLKWAMSSGAVYVYSPYERTTMRALSRKYPEVTKEEEVSELFARPNMVDLYTDVVRKKTEWPLRNHSIKTLAKHLGFSWRDTHPSGAASIEWYHRWVETADAAIAERILQYNEDDCVATKVLLDGIRKLPVQA